VKVAAPPRKVATFLMFEGVAEEAMMFYTSLFEDAEIVAITRYGADGGGVEGTVQYATFSLAGQHFMCIYSTEMHEFSFTPSISLYVQCDTEKEIEHLNAVLAERGRALMPLGSYGFSAKFGWVSDRFGVSWQLNLPQEPVANELRSGRINGQS